MALLNYTTTIDVDKTLSEIQRLLVRSGARSLLMEYTEDGSPRAVSFLIRTPGGEVGFRLPANIDAIFAVLCRQYSDGKVQRRFASKEQAARVGWRIVKDWLEAQLAIIETEMVTFEQVMLPYMTVQNNLSLYEAWSQNLLALPAPK